MGISWGGKEIVPTQYHVSRGHFGLIWNSLDAQELGQGNSLLFWKILAIVAKVNLVSMRPIVANLVVVDVHSPACFLHCENFLAISCIVLVDILSCAINSNSFPDKVALECANSLFSVESFTTVYHSAVDFIAILSRTVPILTA